MTRYKMELNDARDYYAPDIKKLASILLFLLAALLAPVSVSHSDSRISVDNTSNPFPRHFYIDLVNGSNLNSGSIDQPWKTLSSLSKNNFIPGDVIFLHRDQIWRESLNITFSGSVDQPIIIDAYGSGSAPVISGGHVIKKNSVWADPDENGVYSSVIGNSPEFYTNYAVVVNSKTGGASGYRLLPRLAADRLTENSYFIDNINGKRTLFFKPLPNHNPREYQFEVSKRGHVIKISGDYITIRNVNAMLSNSGSRKFDFPIVNAVVYSTGTNTNIINSKVQFGRSLGIAIAGTNSNIISSVAEHNGSTGIYILGKMATHSSVKYSISRYNGNLVFGGNSDRGGIGIQASFSDVSGNQIYNNGNPKDTGGSRPGGDAAISIFQANSVSVTNNFILNSARNAIQMSYDRFSFQHIISYNIIYNWNLLAAESTLNTSAIFVSGFGDTDRSGNFQLLNNTIYSDQINHRLIGITLAIPSANDSIKASVIKNNIIYFSNNLNLSSRGIRVTRGELITFTSIDYNNVFIPLTNKHYGWFSTSEIFDAAEKFSAAKGYERNGINTRPEFIKPEPIKAKDFSLKSTSSLINKGEMVGLLQDFVGSLVADEPDIGALEFLDKDLDLIANYADNCPAIANPDQLDTDFNGIGDICQ